MFSAAAAFVASFAVSACVLLVCFLGSAAAGASVSTVAAFAAAVTTMNAAGLRLRFFFFLDRCLEMPPAVSSTSVLISAWLPRNRLFWRRHHPGQQ